jgi:CubicO group peptidase (beta-lactamase class C family)
MLLGAMACGDDDPAASNTRPGDSSVVDAGASDATASGDAESSLPDTLRRSLEAAGDAAKQASDAPAFAVAIEQGGDVVWSRAWGMADLASETQATPDTPFSIASVSKAVLGVAVMQVVESGKVALNTPIGSLPLPFPVVHPRHEQNAITLEHLTTHSSGIRDGVAYECSYYLDEGRASLANVLGRGPCPDPVDTNLASFLESYLVRERLLYNAAHWAEAAPGASFAYSNVGAALSAVVLSSATGTTLETWTQTKIFDPLGMTRTTWHAASGTPTLATRYLRDDHAAPWTALPSYSLATWPDGGLRASARDLGKFLAAVAEGERNGKPAFLGKDAARTMLSARMSLPEGTGAGWQGVFWHGDGDLFGHTGSDPGAMSLMFHDRVRDVGVVLLVNGSGDDTMSGAMLELYRKLFELMGSKFSL